MPQWVSWCVRLSLRPRVPTVGIKEGREDEGLKGIAHVGREGTSSLGDRGRGGSHPASPNTRPRRSTRLKLPFEGVGESTGDSEGSQDEDPGIQVRTRLVFRPPFLLELFSKEEAESEPLSGTCHHLERRAEATGTPGEPPFLYAETPEGLHQKNNSEPEIAPPGG